MVDLLETPAVEDFEAICDEAEKDCDCTEGQKSNAVPGVTCLPCACRETLNGIATLAEKL